MCIFTALHESKDLTTCTLQISDKDLKDSIQLVGHSTKQSGQTDRACLWRGGGVCVWVGVGGDRLGHAEPAWSYLRL